jgi:ribonuclease HII
VLVPHCISVSGRPTFSNELRLVDQGCELLAGVDEVGRGSWAGPVAVGVCALDSARVRGEVPAFARDSKALTERRRESAFEELTAWCVAWSVGMASNQECDELGMTRALSLAGHRALMDLEGSLGRRPDRLLLDGPHDFLGCGSVVTVVKGDQSCASIAAASVVAKVVRDRMMRALDAEFPPFDFADNKGYPSPAHRRALMGYLPACTAPVGRICKTSSGRLPKVHWRGRWVVTPEA